MSKKKKDKPSAAKVVAKQAKKVNENYLETVAIFNNLPVSMGASELVGHKYSQLVSEFITVLDTFMELEEVLKYNRNIKM